MRISYSAVAVAVPAFVRVERGNLVWSQCPRRRSRHPLPRRTYRFPRHSCVPQVTDYRWRYSLQRALLLLWAQAPCEACVALATLAPFMCPGLAMGFDVSRFGSLAMQSQGLYPKTAQCVEFVRTCIIHRRQPLADASKAKSCKTWPKCLVAPLFVVLR